MSRNRLITLLVVTALLVVAVVEALSHITGNNIGISVGQVVPTGSKRASGQGDTGSTGKVTTAPDAQKPPVQCAGPLPKQSRVQVTKLPEGKLGQWLSVKNEVGREALKFKVDLLETEKINESTERGVTIPTIAALFSLSVENLSCDDLKWSLQRGGLWLSWREPNPKDVGYAWVTSSKGGSTHVSINVQENGNLNIKDDGPKTLVKLVLEKKFGKKGLKELPDPVKPNQTGEAEMLIIVRDPYRKTGLLAPVGLYKDGRLHLALGGELSWALVDLGRAEDWLKK